MSSAEPERSFDIALSFAGEHRSFVRELNTRLTERGVSVFFDEEFQAEMWGENLYDYLQDVYKTKARFVVAFASESYGTKAWPTLERQSAQSRVLSEVGPFLLPVRLDDSELPGILPTIGYVDARIIGLEGLVDLILKKLGIDTTRRSNDPIPLTQAEFEALAHDRPPGWEWYLFAGTLVQGKLALEDRWRDHTIGLKLTNALHLATHQEAITYIQSALDQVRTIVANLERIISVEMQEQAFGPPGTPGDWDLDAYMGSRLVGMYEQLLSWAAEVRSVVVPEEWVNCFALVSTYCDQPIEAVRSGIDAFAAFARNLPAHLADPEAPELRVEIPLKFEIDPTTLALVSAEFDRLRGS